MRITERVQNEPRHTDPLRQANDGAGEAWLKGYADGFKGHNLNTPAKHVEQYLRGYIAQKRT